ncbi:hypothetical protein [Streptomyces griseocarneus]|uniref:hypothetical protein n=1 Tax=Streptomyces griseocarneus TaxID=51201 RepID=UPI00167D70D2|nr:hypothetical protein [Streptomyces griseocarneus]MBZ6474331.1 hypothetical protein [Streptomyces griseocarneus]GHG53354.1 hypothetical protein GCM10018779_15280 [Streptomyces griseocarneus]
MKNHIATRLTAGPVLLAACGLALSAGTARAADGNGAGAPSLTERVSRLASVDTAPVGQAASLVKEEIPKEATGRIYVRSPLADA